MKRVSAMKRTVSFHRDALGPSRRFMAMSLLFLGACVGVVSLLGCGGFDTSPTDEPIVVEGLGSLRFPTSGAPAAQQYFLRGVLLLHSFEYEDAAAAFRQAQGLDPDFAMAYWGEAMTHNHPVWNHRNREAALEALARYAPTPEARRSKAPTPREGDWIGALDVLYEEGEKAVRDTAYSRAMERLVEAYPEDFEARAFHSLSLLGLSQGSRNVPTYMRAGAVALALFDENPDHPGAAHYAIHSFDDPIHAPLGLRAARAYAHIAPEAAHAQHMTSHIFLGLGLWDEVVAANERASDVVNRSRRSRNLGPSRCGHFNEWLVYGYQQLGRLEDAAELVRGCYQDVLDPDFSDFAVDWSSRLSGGTRPGSKPSARDQAARSFARMRALYLADARIEPSEAAYRFLADTDVEIEEPSDAHLSLMDLGTALAAVRRGDHALVQRTLDDLAVRGAADAPFLARYVPVWEGTVRSLLLAALGDLEAALAEARSAAGHEASLPMDYGPPLAAKPARELEGELLLAMGHPEQAIVAFGLALQRTPRRVLSVLGYARAAAASGDDHLATGAYEKLAEILASGDADQEELKEARSFLENRDETPSRR